MGFFNRFRRRDRGDSTYIYQLIKGINAISVSLAKNMFSVPEIRTAIDTVAKLFSTIPMNHERRGEKGVRYLNDDIDAVLNFRTNPLQNKTQFWVTLISHLLVYNNAAAEIVYNDGRISQLVPLPFKTPKFDEIGFVYFTDDPSGKRYPLEETINLNLFSTLKGGETSQATGLHETIIQAIQQRIVKNVTNPVEINAILRGKFGNLKPKDRDARIAEIKEQIDGQAINGMPFINSDIDLIPINISKIETDPQLLKDVVNAVYNYFGLSEAIINNTANEVQIAQFLAKTIRPLANQVAEELTSKFFTLKAYNGGNRISLDVMALEISTLNSKVQLFSNGMLNGYLNADECREYIGQPPLPNGWGQIYRGNLNTVNVEKIDEYQAAKSGASKQKDEGGDESGKDDSLEQPAEG